MDIEMQLLEDRESACNEELDMHTKTLERLVKEEQLMLQKALKRSQEVDDERNELREVIEKARRKQAENITIKQAQMMKKNTV